MYRRITLRLTLLLVLSLVTSCDDARRPTSDAAPDADAHFDDGGREADSDAHGNDADVNEADVNDADVDEDLDEAGDTDEETLSPLRTLVGTTLLDGLSPEERLVALHFDFESMAWFTFGLSPLDHSFTALQQFRPVAPVGQAVLVLPGGDESRNGGIVMALAYLDNDVPLGATVWLGHRESETTGSPPDAEAVVEGLLPTVSHELSVFELNPVPATTQILDGIEWTQFAVTVPEGIVGFGFFMVSYVGGPPLYLNGVSIVEAPAEKRAPASPSRTSQRLRQVRELRRTRIQSTLGDAPFPSYHHSHSSRSR